MGGRVMSTGTCIALIAIGAILRFAVTAKHTHGVNVHVVGVIVLLAGVLGLLLSLLAQASPRRQHSLVRQNRGRYHDEPGPRSRLAMRKRAAAEDVARVQGDDRSFAPDAPGREEDDL